MWLEIQIFGFRALWSPYFLTFVIVLGLVYFLITGPKRTRFGEVSKPTMNQQLFFYILLKVRQLIYSHIS